MDTLHSDQSRGRQVLNLNREKEGLKLPKKRDICSGCTRASLAIGGPCVINLLDIFCEKFPYKFRAGG